MRARYVQYIDQDALYKAQALNEEDQLAYLEEVQDYCHQYKHAIVIFNLDSLAIFSQSERSAGLRGGTEEFTLQQTQHKVRETCLLTTKHLRPIVVLKWCTFGGSLFS